MKKITLVIPVYNESEAIRPFLTAAEKTFCQLERRGYELELLFVNDGSCDDTFDQLVELKQVDGRIRIVDLSRNFGKESALTAGLDEAHGHAAIPIDVDLQDPPEVIPRLIDKWEQGYEVVLARRVDRSTDSLLKSRTATGFYKLFNSLCDLHLPENVGDFRLLDRKVIDALNQLPERSRFMKGLFAWVGFRSTTVDYVRQPRVCGESKFSGWKLWNFALEGIASFSMVPLKLWSYIGTIVACSALAYLAFSLLATLGGREMAPHVGLMVTVLFLGGVQLIGIGVLGEYLARVFAEVKQRPTYIVRDRVAEQEPSMHPQQYSKRAANRSRLSRNIQAA